MGSITYPPCEENVVWFVVDPPFELGETAIDMIRGALNKPESSPADKEDNYDGSYRDV